MLVQILYNLEGKPKGTAANFSDVQADAWYAEAVGWAASNKVVTGYADGTFRPNAAVTREQAAAILYRYAQSKGIDVSVGENTNILSYVDVQQASEYAIPALQWAVGAGVLNVWHRPAPPPVPRSQRSCSAGAKISSKNKRQIEQ